MGYTLKIGEGIVDSYEGIDGDINGYCYIGVETVKHKDAPAYGEPTDYTNERWPSYSNWADFCDMTGLDDVFYDENNFRGGHPGAFLITKKMQVRINNQIILWTSQPEEDIEIIEGEDWTLVRLKWLKYWVDWSLENCKTPVMVNS